MTQVSLWQEQINSSDFAELCNGLYEREVRLLALGEYSEVNALQGRLKSLPYYINRTAHLMTQANNPLELDVQNASWATKQALKMPLVGQESHLVARWYHSHPPALGLVVPIRSTGHIYLDCIDRVDAKQQRVRTNVSGWFSFQDSQQETIGLTNQNNYLLKPNKKVMLAACAGHRWQDNKRKPPIIPSLRELLLSCNINWRNFKSPLIAGG